MVLYVFNYTHWWLETVGIRAGPNMFGCADNFGFLKRTHSTYVPYVEQRRYKCTPHRHILCSEPESKILSCLWLYRTCLKLYQLPFVLHNNNRTPLPWVQVFIDVIPFTTGNQLNGWGRREGGSAAAIHVFIVTVTFAILLLAKFSSGLRNNGHKYKSFHCRTLCFTNKVYPLVRHLLNVS